MSCQPRLFVSWIVLLAILQTILKSYTSGCQCCLHAIKHHITFATSGPGVMATFKACYLFLTFMKMARVLDRSDKTLKALLLLIQHFEGIKNINAVCEELSLECLNGVWHKLHPEFIHNFTGYEPLKIIV
jgi:hypothetical protein